MKSVCLAIVNYNGRKRLEARVAVQHTGKQFLEHTEFNSALS